MLRWTIANNERAARVPVTYEEARDAVRARFEPNWSHGTFCLDDRTITETDEFYVFAIGAKEFLVDGDKSYETIGGVTVVRKEDGAIESMPSPVIATDPTLRGTPNPNPTLQV
jgi:hypothetical protein